MRGVLAIAIAAALGCGHDAKPVVQPDDHPPLPPASGTPIGYLIDDAAELKLTDDQLTQLKTIDSELATKLDLVDSQHGGARPADPSQPQQGRRRGGGRRGGMGGGGMGGGGMGGGGMGGGGMGGRGMRGNRGGSGAGSGSGRPAPTPGASSRATEDRATDVREALARAFQLLDPTQREIARRVLDDRGVDLDAGRSPGPQEPAEPDSGSGSDHEP